MTDSNNDKPTKTTPEIRALLDQEQTAMHKLGETISALETKREENIMDDNLCETIEDELFKERKKQDRHKKRIELLKKDLEKAVQEENREAASRVAGAAKLANDLAADLFQKIYVRACREIAGVMHYDEKAQRLSERASWYAKQAGTKCKIPTPTNIVRNTPYATEEIPSMCNLPDIHDQEKAYWTPEKTSRPGGGVLPGMRGIGGTWKKHEIELPDFEDILKAKNPAAALAKVIKQYAATGQAVAFHDQEEPERNARKNTKKAAG